MTQPANQIAQMPIQVFLDKCNLTHIFCGLTFIQIGMATIQNLTLDNINTMQMAVNPEVIRYPHKVIRSLC